MAITNGYVSLAEGRLAMSTPTAFTDRDALVELAIEAASRDIDAHCDRSFYSYNGGTATARVFAATDPLLLEVDDISSTDGLVIKADDDVDGTYEVTWTTDDYQLEPLNGFIPGIGDTPYTRIRVKPTGNHSFPVYAGQALVEVTAKWGWASTPTAIKQACLAQMVSVYKSPEAAFGVAEVAEFGPIPVRALHPTAARLISHYRKRVF